MLPLMAASATDSTRLRAAGAETVVLGSLAFGDYDHSAWSGCAVEGRA
jgi:hypothetical protein